MFKRIVVAVSPAFSHDQVLNEAIAIAKLGNATILLVHVLSPMEDGYPTPVYPAPNAISSSLHEQAIQAYAQQWDDYQHNAIDYLKNLTGSVSQAGIAVELTQNIGDPGRVICELAHTWNADLVVVGRRGHSGIKQLFLGSVSNYVLHHAPCSVLTVQGELLE